MIAQQIGENLAFINWVVLAGLAVGCFAVVLVGRFADPPATKGFLAFTSFSSAVFAVLAWLSDTGLPAATTAGSPVAPDPAFTPVRQAALLVLAIVALVDAIALLRSAGPPIARALAVAGAVASATAIVAGALAWGDGMPGSLALVVQLAVLALATGGVFGAMVLGHWYLVTPKLPEAPLVRVSRLLLGLVAIQVALFVVSMALGGGVGAQPFQPLVGPWALFVWLRLLIGLVFPLVVSWAAIQTARTRSMESATGLLYIDVGAIAAGTILAAGLYFGAGMFA
ncbi:MAG TPA: hypothetical protein VF802_07500 [Candidatus Limnocylindrales bacterium]